MSARCCHSHGGFCSASVASARSSTSCGERRHSSPVAGSGARRAGTHSTQGARNVRTASRTELPHERTLRVAPDEALRGMHLVDDGWPSPIACARASPRCDFAAADMAAGRAHAQVEPTAAFLAPLRLSLRKGIGQMLAVDRGTSEPAKAAHVSTVGRCSLAGCVVARAGYHFTAVLGCRFLFATSSVAGMAVHTTSGASRRLGALATTPGP